MVIIMMTIHLICLCSAKYLCKCRSLALDQDPSMYPTVGPALLLVNHIDESHSVQQCPAAKTKKLITHT